ncbi:P2 family phage contractile tail tube protein [Brevundimonas sp. 1080]|uniref:phage major tail tube protein n=1 Tax=Brevundimonas sp. 1080 TaxID=3156405 RepID=UPI003392C0AE
MNLPRQLQDMNVHGDGNSFLGECVKFTRPKLTEKLEEYNAGGLLSSVQISTGRIEALECTHTYGGDMPTLNRGFGAVELDANQLRFSGAYQNDAAGQVDDLQIVIRGKHVEIDSGDDEVGSKSGTTYKTNAVYYKQTRNGVVEFEIDVLNNVLLVYGVDRRAQIRGIIGG